MSEFDLPMASFSRGQLPARQTKVVDENQRPLKTGSPGCGGVCNNDVSSSKPCSQGRGGIDALHANNVLFVVVAVDVKLVNILL